MEKGSVCIIFSAGINSIGDTMKTSHAWLSGSPELHRLAINQISMLTSHLFSIMYKYTPTPTHTHTHSVIIVLQCVMKLDKYPQNVDLCCHVRVLHVIQKGASPRHENSFNSPSNSLHILNSTPRASFQISRQQIEQGDSKSQRIAQKAKCEYNKNRLKLFLLFGFQLHTWLQKSLRIHLKNDKVSLMYCARGKLAGGKQSVEFLRCYLKTCMILIEVNSEGGGRPK